MYNTTLYQEHILLAVCYGKGTYLLNASLLSFKVCSWFAPEEKLSRIFLSSVWEQCTSKSSKHTGLDILYLIQYMYYKSAVSRVLSYLAYSIDIYMKSTSLKLATQIS